jgi:hypothetical protein
MPNFENRIGLKAKQRVRAFLERGARIMPWVRELEEARRNLEEARRRFAETRQNLEEARRRFAETRQNLEEARRRFAETRQNLEEAHRKLKEVRQRLARKDNEIAELRAELAQKDAGGRDYGIEHDNVVWIFGSARTGSTWLSNMMEELADHTRWNEPLVGALLGYFYYERAEHRIDKGGKNFILGKRYKKTWLEPVRALVLGGAAARFPELAAGGYLVIKEPNGSIGAPLLMEALPESRMILLIRDPRDVVASSMDARRNGGWQYERRKERGYSRGPLLGKDPNVYAEDRAESYLQSIGNAKQAYDAHQGRKVLVRYEELRADTLGTMRRIYSELEIEVDERELAHAVEKHSWENVPEGEKGPGKIRRKATPGGWREDLTPEQIEIVERMTAPILEEFYSS